jgi:hypothetical protein
MQACSGERALAFPPLGRCCPPARGRRYRSREAARHLQPNPVRAPEIWKNRRIRPNQRARNGPRRLPHIPYPLPARHLSAYQDMANQRLLWSRSDILSMIFLLLIWEPSISTLTSTGRLAAPAALRPLGRVGSPRRLIRLQATSERLRADRFLTAPPSPAVMALFRSAPRRTDGRVARHRRPPEEWQPAG